MFYKCIYLTSRLSILSKSSHSFRCLHGKKFFDNADAAIFDLKSNNTILVGGFGLCGNPEHLLQAVIDRSDLKNLQVISNNAGTDKHGLGKWLHAKKVKRMVSSYVGENAEFERQFLSGELEVELTPQGTLAERIRCGGAGIPAFYTPTGVGTLVHKGGIPIKYDNNGKVVLSSEKKESRLFDKNEYILEHAIKGDFAFIKGYMADTSGNVVFSKSARNFNLPMAKAAKITIVEVEKIVNEGEIDPDHVHLPNLFVDRIIQGKNYVKPIEKIVFQSDSQRDIPLSRLRIIKRAAQEFKDGMVVNLGIGIPNLASGFIPKGKNIKLHSENGILGLGDFPKKNCHDPDIINAGKQTVTVTSDASYFSSDESFGMIRGGHVDLTILGSMQVSKYGDIANYMIPKKMVKGMGGAMDLVSSAHVGTRIIVTMEHSSKSGSFKILNECSLPLTGVKCVDMIITDKCVFSVDKINGLTLEEIAPDTSIEEIKNATECNFTISPNMKEMPL